MKKYQLNEKSQERSKINAPLQSYLFQGSGESYPLKFKTNEEEAATKALNRHHQTTERPKTRTNSLDFKRVQKRRGLWLSKPAWYNSS